jgi:uncharacterized BrkB/YihY/UPF0761 family membrane protein
VGPGPILLKEAALIWVADNAMRLSAAVSFYAILSLAPLLVITLKIVGVATEMSHPSPPATGPTTP